MLLEEADLHLNSVALFQRPVQDPRCVDDLPPQVPVVHVPHKQRLCGECVWLHVHVSAGDLYTRQAWTASHTDRTEAGCTPVSTVHGRGNCLRRRRTVHEAALAHIGVAAHQERPGVRLDCGQPAHVLPDLLQVRQTGPLLLHDCTHAPLHNRTHLLLHLHALYILNQRTLRPTLSNL